ncbi:hypothetical protein ACU4I5_10735 [Ensifer adhaerens]
MNFKRILKLLGTMQTRVERIEKYIQGIDGWEELPELREAIANLKERIATYESRPAILKADAVDRMRQDIRDMRALSASTFFDREVVYAGAERMQLRRALQSDCDALSNLAAGIQIGLSQLTDRDIAQLIPGQKVAAYQFEFEVDRIIVIDQPATASDHEIILADAARELLLEEGERILADLRSSNCPLA